MKSVVRKSLKVFGATVCGVVLLLAVWIAMRWNAPPLRIISDGSKLSVDVSTLGEYPTTVRRIRLSDVNSRAVVWELSGDDGTTQIHGFNLTEGQNAAQIHTDHGSYRMLVPSGSTAFSLREGRQYRLELWGGSSILTKTSASFSLGNSR